MGDVQRHGAKATQKTRSRGRGLLSRPFACICMYNVISVVHQKIGLLIKLFVIVVRKKKYREIANEKNRV